jgi:nitrogen fixation protein NifU and related proteins
MFSDALLDHFRKPRHIGELPAPAVTVEVSNPACGDILRLSALFDGDRIAETGYRVRGCTASIAAGSALTELITGQTRVDLAAISASDIEERLGGLPPASKHVAALCIDGLRALLKVPARVSLNRVDIDLDS